MFSTLPPVVWQASIVPEDGVDNMKLPWNASVLGSSCCWCKSCGYCFFYETACGCADLVIISDLPMISLNHIKSYASNAPFSLTIPTYYFKGSTDFPKHIPNTSDAVAPLRLFASLRCCGHSQRANAWWSDHWGNACIASWDAAFNKLCLTPKVWETKTVTLCALLPCKWNQWHWDLSIAIVQVMNSTVFSHHHPSLVRPKVPNIDHENGLC